VRFAGLKQPRGEPLPLRDFVKAWVKVMELDRFDLKR
jgi:catalase (peroxidase I)